MTNADCKDSADPREPCGTENRDIVLRSRLAEASMVLRRSCLRYERPFEAAWLTGPIGTMCGALCVLMLAVPVEGQTKPAPEPAPDAAKAGPTASMLQLMRGVFFPTANMIFNVQTHDPAQKKSAADAPNPQVFNWVQWGGSLYSGWEDVDYAATVLAEVTPLLLVPGRTCDNGKPVPVERADWVKFTNEMLQAARKSVAAAKSKNQEAVSDSTNDLTDACMACHRVYRDRRPPGAERGSPAASSLRCTVP